MTNDQWKFMDQVIEALGLKGRAITKLTLTFDIHKGLIAEVEEYPSAKGPEILQKLVAEWKES